MRILRNKTSRFEPLNRQKRVGLGVLTPPRPSDVSSSPGGGVRTPGPTFRFVERGNFFQRWRMFIVYCLFPVQQLVVPSPGGEGQGEGERAFQLSSSG